MSELPYPDELFLRFFDPWYEERDRQRRGFSATRPDVMQDESLVGLTQDEASCVNAEGQKVILERIEKMVEATRFDWPTYLAVADEIDLSWIDAFDCYYKREQIAEVIERSDPTNFGNDYLVLCCEFGAALSHVFRVAQPRLAWQLDWPYWDSSLLDPKTGTAISVFHWAIKKMSEYGVDDGYVAKTRACLQFLEEERKLGDRD